jgi:hypothetical protein
MFSHVDGSRNLIYALDITRANMVNETGQAGTNLKIAVMEGVREYGEKYPVEIWRDSIGRTVIRAFNEGRNNSVDLDLWDIIDWLSTGPGRGLLGDEETFRASRIVSR